MALNNNIRKLKFGETTKRWVGAATVMKNMNIQYTKNNINRDMASFARYGTSGFEIQVTYIPLKYKKASKNLARLYTLTQDINSCI